MNIKAPTLDSKKQSPSWWAISLVLHGTLLGLLFLLFPYKEFVKPAAREKVLQPLVNQKTLDTTTKRIEEKQAEEMARKLRELQALSADIQTVEVRQRASHAAFVDTITQISPELAGSLAGLAREQFNQYLELQKADETAWAAFLSSVAEAEPVLDNPADPALKATIAALKERTNAITGTQDKLNFAQAGLLDTQQQIAGRLGFIKSEQPELVEKQADLLNAWGKTMALGATYTSGFEPLQRSLAELSKKSDELSRSRSPLADRQKNLAEIKARLAKRGAKIVTDGEALEKVIAERKELAPTDTKKAKELDRRIDGMRKDLAGTKGQQGNDESKQKEQERAIQAAEEDLLKRTKAVADVLEAILPGRKNLEESRQAYLGEMQRVIDLQKSLDAAMSTSLALPAASATTHPEPATSP